MSFGAIVELPNTAFVTVNEKKVERPLNLAGTMALSVYRLKLQGQQFLSCVQTASRERTPAVAHV